MNYARIFDLEIAAGTRGELTDALLMLIGRGGTVATVNALMLERARKSCEFHRTLSDMSLCIPDGVGVVRAMRSCGVTSEVLPGVELGLLLPMMRPHLRIALYGAAAGVAARAGEKIQSIAPETEIVLVRDGFHHTPFEVARELVPRRPDLVYLCLGSPKQEEVARLFSRDLPQALIIGLGGSFDVWCADKSRAPMPMRRMGLEWLFRMLKEPVRFSQLPALFSFTFHIFLEQMYTKFTKKEKEIPPSKK